ncbi:MAG: tetratricopeptide repeat protein [Planctomycetes bacterium]|nr:tetratricopeptide repeat protein [Planctomycetota bacterium]
MTQPDPAPTRFPRLLRRWRVALAAAALASLPLLWFVSDVAWSGRASREELAAARAALADGRAREARLRAEHVLARVAADAKVPGERRQIAAEAALLASEARLEELARDRQPPPSEIEFAAWRAAQGAAFGGDAAKAAWLRLRAARRLLELGFVAEAIAEYERLETARALGADGEREMAIALASGGPLDRERALPLLERLLAANPPPREAVLTRLALGRALLRLGQPARASMEFKAAAELAGAASMEILAQQARLDQGAALVEDGRFAEAVPYLRALLRDGLTREIRERAGIALAEADAGSDESGLPADLSDLRMLPATPEALFAARARVAHRRLEAGRRADAASTYAAAFDHLTTRPFPEHLVPSPRVLRDLSLLAQYGLDAGDLPALQRAAEGLALSLPESEAALELAAAIAARRAALADEKARAARLARLPAEETAFEARALHGRSAELYLQAADGRAVLKSHSVDNRMLGARETFRGGFHATAEPLLVRLSEELDLQDDRAVEVRWMLARSLQELGRHAEAVTALSRFLEQHRDAPHWAHDAYFELSRSFERLGLFEQAESTLVEFLFRYDNVTPESPRWRDGLFALGDVQARLALDLRARGRDAEAADRAAQAERNLADAVRRFPTAYDPRLRAEYRLGLLAMGRRDWAGGAERFRAGLGLPVAGAAADTGDITRRCSLLLGECHYQLGEWSEALSAFGQAWTTHGGLETVLALQRMSDCHLRLEDARQAERFAQRAREALDQFKARPADARVQGVEERLLERLVAGR